MYPLAVIGNTPTARALLLASAKAGFEDITWVDGPAAALQLPATTLAANTTRIILALDGGDALRDYAHIPDRQQFRLAGSAFLLAELPLGNFTEGRYGAPLVNIDSHLWPDLLAVASTLSPNQPLQELKKDFHVIADCSAPEADLPSTHELWHTQIPVDLKQNKANITWLGQGQTAWQFSTRSATHYLFATPKKLPLHERQWHPLLAQAVVNAKFIGEFNAVAPKVREHWYNGQVVFLGDACYAPNPYLREASACGLEDAWVLSRMLENYEEDIAEGLQQYAKYRYPRARKIVTHGSTIAQQQNITQSPRRFFNHFKFAFNTRFLPEIAMQGIDWFYGYDCIRGFR